MWVTQRSWLSSIPWNRKFPGIKSASPGYPVWVERFVSGQVQAHPAGRQVQQVSLLIRWVTWRDCWGGGGQLLLHWSRISVAVGLILPAVFYVTSKGGAGRLFHRVHAAPSALLTYKCLPGCHEDIRWLKKKKVPTETFSLLGAVNSEFITGPALQSSAESSSVRRLSEKWTSGFSFVFTVGQISWHGKERSVRAAQFGSGRTGLRVCQINSGPFSAFYRSVWKNPQLFTLAAV